MPDNEKAFGDLERELSLLLRRARALSGVLSREVHPDLDAAGYVLLSSLAAGGPMRANDVAELFGVDKSSISRQVQRLEGLGLLERREDASDGRAMLLAATPEGQRRLAAATHARRAGFRTRLSGWSAKDVNELARLLERLNRSAD